MKKIVSKIYLIFIVLVLFLTGTVFGSNIEFKEPEYTEVYKQWLQLSDEEKENAIEPSKYSFSSRKTNEETQFSNQNANLKGLLRMTKSSAYSSDNYFSLKTLINNNLTIRSQKNTNFCWAFAAISSLETNLALKNYYDNAEEKIYDYSERHTAYSMTQSFLDGQINSRGWNYKVKDGGNAIMATAYLTNGSGAIDESDMEFVDSEAEIDISNIQDKTVKTTVNDIRYLDDMYITKSDGIIDLDGNALSEAKLTTLKNEMKEHISTNGSIYASIHMPALTDTTNMNLKTGAIYCEMSSYESINNQYKSGKIYPNHGVSIIGWNDTYSKENFATEPSSDGAWIVRNSYGESYDISMTQLRAMHSGYSDDDIVKLYSAYMNCTLSENGETLKVTMGDNGVFYVSYEDAYAYTGLVGIESADDEVTYDNLYQYDELGGSSANYLMDSKQYDTYLANVFTRTTTETEYLTSIGLESLTEGTYEVYINPNGTDKSLSSLQKAELTTGDDITLTAGYHTISLKNAYELKETNFVIAIKMKHTEGEYSYFTYESSDQNPNLDLSNAKESFVVSAKEVSSDSEWLDISDKSGDNYLGNLCIKGITVNKYSGTIANVTGNNSGNNSESDTLGEEDNLPKNSNYDKAMAQLQKLQIASNEKETFMDIVININGIQVENLCENYQHYFYVSSKSDAKNIEESKWLRAGKFEKQADGTYTLTIEITDESQLADIDESGSIYVYVKEIATTGENSTTLITIAMELNIFTSELNKEDDDNGTTITYNPAIESTKKDTTIANKILPNTGYIPVIIAGIIMIGIVGILGYIRYRNIDK